MATRTINTRINIDGEKEYRAKLQTINSQYALLKSELAKLKSESEGAANSEENLQKKVDLLTRAKQNLTEKLSLYNARLNSAKAKQEEYAQTISGLHEDIQRVTQRQEDLGEVTEENAEEHERLNKELQEYQQQLQQAEEEQRRADESVQRWQTQVNNAEVSVNRLSEELETNQRYLDEASQSGNHAAQSIDEYGRTVQEAAEETEEFGERSQGALEALAANLISNGIESGIDNIKNALLDCITAAGQFETAVAKVGTIADTNAVPLEDLKGQIATLSTELGVSASEIAESTYNAISASVETAGAVGFVEQATKLAAGGFTDTTTAVDILSTAINAYGLETSQASQLADYLITTQNLGKTSVAELAVNMGKVIPIASAYNVEMDNLSTAYAVLTANGIATAESTTYLKSMLNELGDSGSIVSATLEEATGKSFSTLTREGKSLGDVIEILGDSVDGDTGAFNELWSSSEAGVGALSLLGAGSEKYNSVLEQMQKSSGATDTAFEKMTDTLEYSEQKMNVAIENMKAAIGDQLAPAFKKVTDAGTDVFAWATEFVQEHPEVVAAIGALTAALGAVAAAIVGITTVTTVASQVLKAFGEIINTHPAALFITILTTLGTALATYMALLGDSETETARLSRETEELKASIDETIQTYSTAKDEIQQNTDAQKGLASELTKLIHQEEKTAETKSRIEEIVGILNTEIPELSLAYDRQTDSLNMTTEALDDLLKQQAREQEYNEVIEERTELLKNRSKATELLQEAEENLSEVEENYNAILGENAETTELTQAQITQLEIQLRNAQAAYQDAQNAVISIDTELQNSEGIIADHQLSLAGMSESVIAQRDALLESAAAFGENSMECQAVQEALAALDEQYIMHTGELRQRIDELKAQQEELRAEHEATKQKIQDTLTNEMGMFEKVSIKGYDSIDKLIGAMDSQISYMDTYAENMQKAMELGVDEGIVKTLSDGSIDSAKILQAIVDDGGKNVDEFNAKFKKVEEGKETFSENLAEMQDNFSETMRELQEELSTTVTALNMEEDMYTSGMQTVQGFINGSSRMQGEVINTYTQLARAAMNAVKREFDQHSPSRKFYQIGQYNVLGAIQGTEDERPHLEEAYADTASAAIESYNRRTEALMDDMKSNRYVEYFALPSSMKQSGEIRLPEISADPALALTLERLADVMEQRARSNGITQNVTIVNPEGTPAANARALRRVERGLAFGL